MMHYYSNHICCHTSNWDSKLFDCKYMIKVNRYANREDIYSRKNTPDWNRIFDKVEGVFLEKEHNEYNERFPDEKADKGFFVKNTYRLKPEVYRWLDENVADVIDPEDIPGEETVKGWCTGDDSYNSKMGIECSLFFQRRSDALAFVKEWSEYGKPITYFNYFKGTKKEYNDETGTLQVVDEFTRV